MSGRGYAMRLLLLAVVYWLTARLGLAFAVVNASASPVWAPAGIAIGVLVVGGMRYGPGVFVGALAANVAVAGHWPSSVLIAGGNTLEAVFGSWAVRRWCGGRQAFDKTATTALFVWWAALVAPLVSSLVGVVSLASFGLASWSGLGPVWATWYLGDATGIVVVAPAILLATQWRNLRWGSLWEAVAYPVVLVLVGLLAFGPLRPSGLVDVRLGALALPVVAWAAIRFGPLVASWSTLLLTGMAVAGSLAQTVGPTAGNPNVALLELQGLLGILTLFGLSVAAVVHERRLAFEALAASNMGLEALVEERTMRLRSAMRDLHEAQELAGLGSWTYNAGSHLFGGSPWLHRTFDVATAAPLDAWVRNVAADGDVSLPKALRGAMARGVPFSFSIRVRVGDRVRHLQFTGTPLPGRGWHGTCQDITVAKEAEAAARHLAVLVEANPLALVAATADGTIETWNGAAQDLFGYSAKEALGMKLDRLVPEADRGEIQGLRDRIMAGGGVVEMRCERLHKDGRLIPVHLTLAPFEDPEDGALRLMAILRDRRPELEAQRMVDEARRIEHELKALDHVTMLKSEFINMASHELRTPLTPIRVQLHLLKSGVLDEAGAMRSLVVMERNMVRLSDLVEDIFAAARLQSGGFAIHTREVEFASLVHDVVHTFEAQAHEHQVALDVRVRGFTSLQADPDRLTQVLFNLLGNALKYAPEGSTVHVDLVGGSQHVRLAVEDEGTGVPEALLERLFEPFGRMESDGKPGTGLGLYICKGIAELHGGRIRLAASRYGDGARFEVVLPRGVPRSVARGSVGPASPAGRGEGGVGRKRPGRPGRAAEGARTVGEGRVGKSGV